MKYGYNAKGEFVIASADPVLRAAYIQNGKVAQWTDKAPLDKKTEEAHTGSRSSS